MAEFDGYQLPLSPEDKSLLAKQKEEEEVGFDPMRAAALSAGASLLRNSGWSRNPMSLGESIGHAIPAGMQGYYNQDALNQNEQAALYERQQAEQTALDAKLKVEDDARTAKDRATEFKAMLIESGLSRELKRFYMEMYADDPTKTFTALEKKLTEKKASEEKFRVLDPEDSADAKLLKGFKRDRLWQINTKNNKITEVTGSTESVDEKKASRLTMDEALLAGYSEATAIPPMGGLRLNKDGTRTVVDRYGNPYKGPVEINQYAGYEKHRREDELGNEVAVWTHTDPLKPDIPVKGIVKTKEETGVDPYSGYKLLTRDTKEGNTEQFYSHPDPEKADIPVDGFKKRVTVDPEVLALATGDLSLGNPESEGYKAAAIHLSKAGFLTPEELKKGSISSVSVMRDANGNMSFEFKDKDGHTLTESAAHELKVAGLGIKEDTLELKQEQFYTRTQQWETKHTESMWQKAKENKWTRERIEREIQTHDIQQKQRVQNYGGTAYLQRSEFLDIYGGELGDKVAYVETSSDGTITKKLDKNYDEIRLPLDGVNKETLKVELSSLYQQYPSIFTAQNQSAVNLLLQGKDPMLALKSAHNMLTKKKVLIAPPAMVTKMYQVDLGVIESAEAALALLREEEARSGVGFLKGRVTGKWKNSIFQAFNALKTEAALIKRNEMIGSQMTDGEIKFSTPFFPDETDSLTSAKTKLEILVRVSRNRAKRIKNMFSAKAGYNEKIWIPAQNENYSPEQIEQIRNNEPITPKLKTAGDLEK